MMMKCFSTIGATLFIVASAATELFPDGTPEPLPAPMTGTIPSGIRQLTSLADLLSSIPSATNLADPSSLTETTEVPFDGCDVEKRINIDQYEVFVVGKKGSERLPQVEVDLEKADEEGANDSLNGKIYLEFNTKQLTFEEQDAVAGKMDLLDGFNEIYTDFGEGDCSDGTVLEKGLVITRIQSFNYNAQKNYPAKKQNECFPQGNEGKVVELKFKFKDYTDVQKTVNEVDTIEFCVRVGYVKEINNEDDDVVISYIDTKITGTIDVTGGFNTFTQNVDVEKTDATEFDTEVQKSVPIVTSVCKKNYENVNVDRTYVNGQNFRICVVSEDITAYEVVDFKSLSCGDGEFERNLYDESKLNNGITAFSGIDEKTKKMAMKSVLTSGLVAQGIKSGSGMVLCRGEVSLKNVAGRRSRGRNLQEEASVEGESLTTPFEMNINLDTPATNDNNNIESSAPLPSSITTTTVAVIGFGSILSFVFSMIL